MPERDLRGATEQDREHDRRDREEDVLGFLGVTALETAGPLNPPNVEGGQDSSQHGNDEEILDRAQRAPSSDQWDMEAVLVNRAEGLHDGGEEDEETPEDEEVHEAGPRPLQELPLTEDHHQLLSDLEPDRVRLSVVRPAEAQKADEVARSLGKQSERDQDYGGHGDLFEHSRGLLSLPPDLTAQSTSDAV